MQSTVFSGNDNENIFSRADMTLAPYPTFAPSSADADNARALKSENNNAAAQLPDWARELLQSPDGSIPKETGYQSVFGNRSGSGSGTGRLQGQINWTSPYAQNAARPSPDSVNMPTPIDLKQPSRDAQQTEQSASKPSVMPSRGEIERMADKVYSIIEERLRREMRRNGR